jgi:magnesium-protoporphyrin O-methyltransferase
LLDVGAGIGIISAELATNGLFSATLVDASPSYLEAARRVVEPHFESRPIRFLLGDFTAIAANLNEADVVTLDRVVCCYPDAQALLRAGASRTRDLLAFTYPRFRWYVRAMIALENFVRSLRRSPFRAFVHPPSGMHATLEAAGLVRVARRETLVWALDIFQRNGCASKKG